MLDVALKMTPEELEAIRRESYLMGKYDHMFPSSGRTLSAFGEEGGGIVADIEEGSEHMVELLSAMYNAFARTFGDYE